MNTNETYTTQSLNIAAYLKANKVEPLHIEKQNGKAVFHFPKSPETKKLVEMYLEDVTLKRFIGAFREIKEMVAKGR